MLNKLTNKRKIFISEYLKDKNATQAAIRAGYSKKTAYSIGQELLNKPEIKETIEQTLSKITQKCEITVEKVLNDIEDCRVRSRFMDDHRSELKASELEGKHLQMYTDVVKTDQVINVIIKKH